MNSQPIHYDHMPSPVGRLLLAADALGLRRIGFEHERHPVAIGEDWLHAPQRLAFARSQLEEYFAGTRQHFDLPLHPLGTAFQCAVWTALTRIPYGTTISYADLACRIEKPRAMRAVGAANGRNPLPIVVPCHRVIGRDGSLTGFGGGLPVKARLLALEAAHRDDDLFAANA
jgi:methylated-DNA-[protein]-cysteine S-methyltransferase